MKLLRFHCPFQRVNVLLLVISFFENELI
jgi:hypothetical protein